MIDKIECTCFHCGKSFWLYPSQVAHRKPKYCSRDCKHIGQTKKIPRKCLVCCKQFVTIPVEISKGGGKYCSPKCHSISLQKRISCICKLCNKPFIRLASKVGNYCSRKCRDNAKVVRITRICQYCQNAFEVPQHWITSGHGIYCSPQCKGKASRGEHNPAWKGGQRRSYRGANWVEQRNLAYQRDNATCQLCHKKQRKEDKKFPIHHIKPYHEFNGDYLAANNLLNLITLCHTCHGKVEWGTLDAPKRLF